MDALVHVIMHVAFCKTIARVAPTTPIAMRVVVTNRIHQSLYDRTVRFRRGTAGDTVVEYDLQPGGVYRVSVALSKYPCSGVEYMRLYADHNRRLALNLVDGGARGPAPLLVIGTVPQEFAYSKPDVVLFPASLKCNASVGDPQTTGIETDVEQDGFYTSLVTPALYRNPVAATIAMRLNDSSGGTHYVRIPWNMASSPAWPSTIQVRVDDNLLDWAAGQPEDVLLCPAFYRIIEENG